MNTMEIDGVKFELILHGQGCTDVPSVICDGKAYIGQAILNKPEKDYEIGIIKVENKTYYRNRNNMFCLQPYFDTGFYNEYELLHKKGVIVTVKRLFDNETFSIVDKTDGGIIASFSIWNKRILVSFEEEDKFSCYLNSAENKIKKLKKPLLKTSDGVDIYEGDKYWYVNMVYEIHELTGESRRLWNNSLMPNEKTFSTKELALEWITLNKPCLSVNDVKEFFPLSEYNTLKLKDLAKKKINATD